MAKEHRAYTSNLLQNELTVETAEFNDRTPRAGLPIVPFVAS